MADVVAGPERDVVPDLHERLDDIVLQNEAVRANYAAEAGGARAQVGGKGVALFLCLQEARLSDLVGLLVSEGNEYVVRLRCMAFLQRLKGHDGQALKNVLLY